MYLLSKNLTLRSIYIRELWFMSYRIAVVGGGYAGLAAISELSRNSAFDIHLFDDSLNHLQLTHLHKVTNFSLDLLRISFDSLARRFSFRFHHQSFDEPTLESISATKEINGQKFDFIIITTGAEAIELQPSSEHIITEKYVKEKGLLPKLEPMLGSTNLKISLVGLGPTSIQFLFELDDLLKKHNDQYTLRAIGMDSRVLPNFDPAFDRYIRNKAAIKGIELFLESKFLNQNERDLAIATASGDKVLESDLTIQFIGVKPHHKLYQCNTHGQIEAAPTGVFAAGDCSNYSGTGLNRMSAQAAVRKGKHCAKNIIALIENKKLIKYSYGELGYFVSLGSADGIGWMFWEQNVLSGFPALAIKEAIEIQFRLLLKGINTYIF